MKESQLEFELRQYFVSHGCLHLRSVGTKHFDILFKGVRYAELPRKLHGIRIVEASSEEIRRISRILKVQVASSDIRVLESSGERFVVMSAYAASGDDLRALSGELFWTSPARSGVPVQFDRYEPQCVSREASGKDIASESSCDEFVSERIFQLWEYHSGHESLLIRSGGGSSLEDIDIICRRLSYFELPRVLNGLRIVAPTDEEIFRLHRIPSALGVKGTLRVFQSAGRRFVVVADSVEVRKHNRGSLWSPFWEI